MHMQNPFLHILVPHDGSEMSDKALDEAIRFAKSFNSKITLLHVVDGRVAPPSVLLSFIKERTSLKEATAELLGVLKTGAENMLKDRMDRVKNAGLDVKIDIEIDSPAQSIVKFAKEKKADIIIMGSRQFKNVGKIKMLGSVARRVAETAEIPVMLVH